MKAREGKIGRVFVIRLEDGDKIPDCLETFADDNSVKAGHVVLVGGIGGGQIVAGPRNSNARPPDPMLLPIDGAHEVAGVGVMVIRRDRGRCIVLPVASLQPPVSTAHPLRKLVRANVVEIDPRHG